MHGSATVFRPSRSGQCSLRTLASRAWEPRRSWQKPETLRALNPGFAFSWMASPYGVTDASERGTAMTKRSALTMAASLAVALLIGVAAIALMVGDVSVATAGGERKPIVKRQVQTVTVHRKAHGDASPSVQVVHLGSGSATSLSSVAASDGEGFESDDDGTFDDGTVGSSQDGATEGTVGDD